jgi:hypothetical protein
VLPPSAFASAASASAHPASLELRVHGAPGAQLPAGSGIFRACNDVAAFERLLLSPPPPPPAAPPPHAAHASQEHGGGDAERGSRMLQDGANVTIIADVVTVNGSAVAGAAGGSVTVATGSHPRAHAAHPSHAVAAAPAPAAPPPPADGHVNLSIEDASGGELRFRVPVSTPLHTLLDMYCARRGVSRTGACFAGPRGGQLNPALTVRAAGLRERDVITMERA